MMSLRSLLPGPLPVTAPLVLNPLTARMVEAAGFRAGYLGGIERLLAVERATVEKGAD
jgi:2-methylisocitrate lyase-like PEP mutase family enzyme